MSDDWSDDDRDKALAWQAEERAACGRCGTPVHEGTDPDAVFTAGNPIECHVCRVRAQQAEKYRESAGWLFFPVTKDG